MGIKNSTIVRFNLYHFKNRKSIKATVCPMVKSETKISAFFQSLKVKGTTNAIKNKT